jgi:hypothetical protein
MHKTLLAAAALAAVLSVGATASKAAAMPAMAMPALVTPTLAPTQLGVATSADSNLVQKAGLTCGYYGCWNAWWGGGPYWRPHYWHRPYWAWQRHYWGWHRWW